MGYMGIFYEAMKGIYILHNGYKLHASQRNKFRGRIGIAEEICTGFFRFYRAHVHVKRQMSMHMILHIHDHS